MKLPIMTLAEDVERICRFLATNNDTCSVEAAKQSIEGKFLDHRKINAYTTWGFVSSKSGKITLLNRGKQLLEEKKEEERLIIYQDVIIDSKVYLAAVKWVAEITQRTVSCDEIANFWRHNTSFNLNSSKDHTLNYPFLLLMAVKLC